MSVGARPNTTMLPTATPAEMGSEYWQPHNAGSAMASRARKAWHGARFAVMRGRRAELVRVTAIFGWDT